MNVNRLEKGLEGHSEESSSDTSSKREARRVAAKTTKTCCLACFRVLELFKTRHYSIVFKSENTTRELKKIKAKLIDHWVKDPNSCLFLLKIYKYAKKDVDIQNDITKDIEKKRLDKIKQRAQSQESITRKSTIISRNLSRSRLSFFG